MTSTLSIIIPTFRRKESLQLLLQRLVAQQEIVPEIIVVDQNPAGWLGSVFEAFPSVRRLVLNTPNVSDARNKGFLASGGEVILFIDDDLIPEKDFCISALELLRIYPDISCFSPLVYNAEGKEIALQQARTKMISVFQDDPKIFSITDTLSAALFFRRAYYTATGGFDPLLFGFAKTAEDQELFLRMQKRKLHLYYVPSVEVYHDETIPGGCELRTQDYWISREKCMRSWAYRRRIHHAPPGTLSARDLFGLARSGFLNREVLASGIKDIRRQIKLLKASIRASGEFLRSLKAPYPPPDTIDHLAASDHHVDHPGKKDPPGAT
jgi:GT2 family glycosyltransferase